MNTSLLPTAVTLCYTFVVYIAYLRHLNSEYRTYYVIRDYGSAAQGTRVRALQAITEVQPTTMKVAAQQQKTMSTTETECCSLQHPDDEKKE